MFLNLVQQKTKSHEKSREWKDFKSMIHRFKKIKTRQCSVNWGNQKGKLRRGAEERSENIANNFFNFFLFIQIGTMVVKNGFV